MSLAIGKTRGGRVGGRVGGFPESERAIRGAPEAPEGVARKVLPARRSPPAGEIAGMGED